MNDSSNSLARLDAASRALAEASSVYEAKDVRDTAEAVRRVAQVAKNRDLELQAAEIRVRAERRLGELLIEYGIGRGAHFRKVTLGNSLPPSLDEIGIDKRLSRRAQSLARLDPAEFEARLAVWREEAERREARVLSSLLKAVARPAAAASPPPLPEGKYRVIYADPPWRFQTFSARGLDRGAENHYPTMDRAAIEALPVGGLAADDCCLFLWAVGPMLPEAFAVMMAWGFEFKSVAFVWAKSARGDAEDAERGPPRAPRAEGAASPREHPPRFPLGLGYWTRQQAEVCLLATRGSPKPRARDVP